MTKEAIVVFARMDSRRAPGKVLADLHGRPMLGRVLDRLRRATSMPRVIVATSDRPIDDPIEAFARQENAEVFRGAADDVAARATACAEAFGLDWFVRICGDSPFIDPSLIDAAAALYRRAAPDVAGNLFPRTFPKGCSVEAISAAAMRRLLRETDDPSLREHVTAFIYQQPDNWRIENLAAGRPDFLGASLVVDTPEELATARRMIKRMVERGKDPAAASIDDLLALQAESSTA